MILTLALMVACSGAPASPASDVAPASQAAKSSHRDIDTNALAADLEAGRVPVLVDVRTPGEFAGGHVPGAVNIPLNELGSRSSELEAWREGEVYLVCQSGGRSARAAKELGANGFSTVNVTGGTGAWKAAGRSVQ